MLVAEGVAVAVGVIDAVGVGVGVEVAVGVGVGVSDAEGVGVGNGARGPQAECLNGHLFFFLFCTQ